MSYDLTEDKLRKANKKLLKDIHKHLGITKSELSSSQLLQFLSQSFFSKPYEEVKETILNNAELHLDFGNNTYDVFKTRDLAKVHVLHYKNQKIITYNGEYHRSLNLNLDDEISFEELQKIANLMAISNKSYVKEVYLPEILDEFDEEDESNIIQIAKNMGYFDYPEAIFDMIDKYDSLVNNEYTPFSLDGEWMSEIVSEYDEDSDIGDYVIWHPEIGNDKDTNHKEFYFSFNDLCKARKQSDGTWLVHELGNDKITHVISFRSKDNIK